ncbi:hypothetical protein [Mesorhizobium comanense]|jgi:hypothetical protein|uniref:hypothetical protein n=1 Tax=Mesorhizobium comanense TaxID=2502215 RepID=UPI001485686A|nr:hypothetical protein [Mesorhizobium comanense]
MIQFLNIFGDVMRIATFQWRDETHHAMRCEEPANPDRWSYPVARRPLRRSRP